MTSTTHPSLTAFFTTPETMRLVFNQYRADAACTDGTEVHAVNREVLHGAIGLCTEIGEMAYPRDDANLREECGDALWYVSRLCAGLGRDIPLPNDYHARNAPDRFADLVVSSAEILDQVKKAIFYGKPVDGDKVMLEVQEVINDLHGVAIALNTTLPNLMDANIAKLKARYPNKFTQQAALNRDTVAEMVAHDAALNG